MAKLKPVTRIPCLQFLFRPLCLSLLVSVLLTSAVPAHNATDYTTQRKVYVEADRLLNKKRIEQWLYIKPQLKTYPLYPYLIFKEIRHTQHRYSNADIDGYIDRFNVPLTSSIRKWWLYRLHSKQDWTLILKHFSGSKKKSTQCVVALAAFHTLDAQKALEYIRPLWLVGKSQHKQCDPVFERALKSRLIDDQLIWQRALLTAIRGRTKMTSYLHSLLKSDEIRIWVERLSRVYRNPKTQLKRNVVIWNQSPFGRETIVLGVTRLAKIDPISAATYWREVNRNQLANEGPIEANKAIAQRLGWRRHASANDWLARLPKEMQNHSILELRARSALASENWGHLEATLDSMPEDLAQRDVWRYWRASVSMRHGRVEQAHEIFEQLATQRNYYGFLAADRLNMQYNFTPSGVRFDKADLKAFVDAEPAIARIREWLALSKPYRARAELHSLKQKRESDTEFWLLAGQIFHSWDWNDGTIHAAFRSQKHADFPLSMTYPTPYARQVERESKRYDISEDWIFGIMRQESLFIHDVRSGAGAIGLMQLMPGTARRVAKRNKLKSPTRGDLTIASLNVRLGTSYIRQMLNRLNGNVVHSLVAYNAGPRRVTLWSNRIQTSKLEFWIESIPFTETRNYVKKVLANFIIYEYLNTANTTSLSDYLKPKHSTQ